ncbi:hypothetical protein [Microbacterium testaceum]|uniref:hypothetical protein n=1 Tax=Microbacterium testaceum TaxID=2033 RepID=UPI000B208310|nr:hypothetical protein [Microbacterium testaceum]
MTPALAAAIARAENSGAPGRALRPDAAALSAAARSVAARFAAARSVAARSVASVSKTPGRFSEESGFLGHSTDQPDGDARRNGRRR